MRHHQNHSIVRPIADAPATHVDDGDSFDGARTTTMAVAEAAAVAVTEAPAVVAYDDSKCVRRATIVADGADDSDGHRCFAHRNSKDDRCALRSAVDRGPLPSVWAVDGAGYGRHA